MHTENIMLDDNSILKKKKVFLETNALDRFIDLKLEQMSSSAARGLQPSEPDFILFLPEIAK